MAIQKPTATEVKEIVSTSKSDAVVSSMIEDAALMAEKCITSLDGDRQEAILRYLTAHMIVISDGGGAGAVVSEKLGDAQRNYSAVPLGESLRSSGFGQQAIALDPNGCLANIGKTATKMRLV